MKKLYFDATEKNECIAIFSPQAEIVSAGTTVYAMPIKDWNEEYQRYADEYDIHFIFDNALPHIDFYTVPQVDILAVDSNGGYIGTVGQQSDLESAAPICYIDKNRNCYLVANNGAAFLESVSAWKDNLKPYHEITFYKSKSDAEKVLTFVDRQTLGIDL